MSGSFLKYMTALWDQFGAFGFILIVMAAAVVLVVAMMFQKGRAILFWLYVILYLIGVGISKETKTLSYRQPVLPIGIVSVCSSMRWFVLIALSILGLLTIFKGKIRWNSLLVLLVFWGLWAIATGIVAGGGIALERAITFNLIILASLAVWEYGRSYWDFNYFMRVSYWISILVAIFLCCAVIMAPGRVTMGGRFRGFVDNPNMMSWIAFTMIVPALWAWLDPAHDGTKTKKVGFVLVIVYALSLLSTGSRAGVLSILPVLLVVVKARAKNVGFWVSMMVVISVILVVAIYLTPEEALSHLVSIDPASRNRHFIIAAGIALQSPAIGYGFGYADTQVVDPATGLGIHNGFMKIAIDMGLLGLGLLLGAFWITRTNWRRAAATCRYAGVSDLGPKLLCALVFGHFLDSAAEGWLTGVGSSQLFFLIFLWTFLSSMRYGFEHDPDLQFQEEAEAYQEQGYAYAPTGAYR